MNNCSKAARHPVLSYPEQQQGPRRVRLFAALTSCRSRPPASANPWPRDYLRLQFSASAYYPSGQHTTWGILPKSAIRCRRLDNLASRQHCGKVNSNSIQG